MVPMMKGRTVGTAGKTIGQTPFRRLMSDDAYTWTSAILDVSAGR